MCIKLELTIGTLVTELYKKDETEPKKIQKSENLPNCMDYDNNPKGVQ